MSTALRQLGALLSLRWQMIRSARVRMVIRLVGLLVVFLLIEAARSGGHLEKAALATAVKLAPQAFLGFGVLAVVAPLTAGGGNQLFPQDQLVAYPVLPRTQFIGGLLLAPVNLVWALQIIALVAETAYLTHGGNAFLGAVTALAFVAALTVAGQALAWLVAGLRQTRSGRRLAGALGLSALIAGVVIVKSGSGQAVLDASPTHDVVAGVVAGAQGRIGPWSATTGILLGILVVGLLLGSRTCAWALRRPGDAGAVRESRPVRRRTRRGGQLRELVAVDRGSVWRAPALRRGGLVLALMPGLAAAGAGVPWQSMIVLPGLVAAGAGLLFGVNAFCLDGSGALWMASLPHQPGLVARAKLLVLTETVLAAVAIAAVTGSLRSPGTPTTTQLVAIATSALCASALVVATSLSMSVAHPHRADLKGPRDAVAPPGSLAMASARLALPAGLVGMVFQGTAASERWWSTVVLALPLLAACAVWVRRSLGRYDQPWVRSRIVQVVSSG